MARSMWMARRPKAVAVAANRIGGGRDEAAAEADDGDQRGEAAEDEDDRLRFEAFALGEIAAPCQPEIADGEHGHPGGDDIGHGLRTHAVGRRNLHRAGVPEDHQRDQQQNAGNDHAGGVGLSGRRPRLVHVQRSPQRLQLIFQVRH